MSTLDCIIKRAWKSSEFFISSSRETINDSPLNQTLSSDFQSSVNGKRWRVEWSSVFQHRSENLPFGKNLEDSPSPSFASLQCSCLISEDSGKWFPAFSWAHLVERSSLLWRKPNSLIGGSGYKKNAPWIKNKNILPFYFHQLTWILPSEETPHIFNPFFPLTTL